jgi:two-component system, NarL family, response regulator NreC
MPIRVLLVDDHQIVRQGLRAILETESDIEIVGEAANGAIAVAATAKLRPDVVVMDVAMPLVNGIEATRQIMAQNDHVRILALSMHGNRQIVLETLRAGAAGYLLKDCARDDLAQAIRTVKSQLAFFSPEVADIVFQEYGEQSKEPAVQLSSREHEITALAGAGLSDIEIASRLGLTARTIGAYRRQILRKLKLRTAGDLTKYAIRNGMCGIDAREA